MIQAQILADSITQSGDRLTTFKLTYPRFIHSEVMTHRVFSRNASSSRAIPVGKSIERVKTQPAVPEQFGANQRGMVAVNNLTPEEIETARAEWLLASQSASEHAQSLADLNVHKQIVNRILEPFSHIQVVLSSTRWRGFYRQRVDENADPTMRELATQMLKAHKESTPVELQQGEWHLPFITEDMLQELDTETLKKIAVARCARVSYWLHDGTESDPEKDIQLHNFLAHQGHYSPFEHIATPGIGVSNFRGWKQYREYLPNQDFSEDDSEIYEELNRLKIS
jgi:thymidylate synthase ThyX